MGGPAGHKHGGCLLLVVPEDLVSDPAVENTLVRPKVGGWLLPHEGLSVQQRHRPALRSLPAPGPASRRSKRIIITINTEGASAGSGAPRPREEGASRRVPPPGGAGEEREKAAAAFCVPDTPLPAWDCARSGGSCLRLPLPHNGAVTPSGGRRRRPPPQPPNVLGSGIPRPPRFVSSGSPAPGSPPSSASDPHTPGRTPTSTPPPPPPPPPRKANTQEGQRRPLISLLPFLPGRCLMGVLALPTPRCASPRPPPDSAAAGQRGRDAGGCSRSGLPLRGLPPLPSCPPGAAARCPCCSAGAKRGRLRRVSPFSSAPPAPGKFLIYFFKPSIRKSCGEEPSPALPYIFIGRLVPSSVCHTGRQRATLLING